jgi:hypothetical protein
MCSYESSDDRRSTAQMNSELQHAQLELLAAHCATHKLRLHYSADDLARFGRRDVLRKSAEAASSLNEFYQTIEKKNPQNTRHMVPTWGLAASGGTWAGTENYFALTLGAWRLARKKASAIRQGLCRDSGPMLPGDCPHIGSSTGGLLKRKTPRLKG